MDLLQADRSALEALAAQPGSGVHAAMYIPADGGQPVPTFIVVDRNNPHSGHVTQHANGVFITASTLDIGSTPERLSIFQVNDERRYQIDVPPEDHADASLVTSVCIPLD